MEWFAWGCDSLKYFLDLLLHLDRHLDTLVASYGFWMYPLLFTIIFCETGLVATPILPGDSLLFTAGAISARAEVLNPHLLACLLTAAAILGDTVNYWIGHFVGPRVFNREKSWFFNPAHLRRTRKFYEKHGGKTIIIARFVPIIRTFAPFVAGIGKMSYPRFIFYNIFGAVLWVGTILYLGFFFGNLPLVKKNFTAVIFIIIFLSCLPPVIEYLRHRNDPEEEASEDSAPPVSHP